MASVFFLLVVAPQKGWASRQITMAVGFPYMFATPPPQKKKRVGFHQPPTRDDHHSAVARWRPWLSAPWQRPGQRVSCCWASWCARAWTRLGRWDFELNVPRSPRRPKMGSREPSQVFQFRFLCFSESEAQNSLQGTGTPTSFSFIVGVWMYGSFSSS